MFLKYYNHTMSLNFERFSSSYEIYFAKKNIDRNIDNNEDFFKILLSDILR